MSIFLMGAKELLFDNFDQDDKLISNDDLNLSSNIKLFTFAQWNFFLFSLFFFIL